MLLPKTKGCLGQREGGKEGGEGRREGREGGIDGERHRPRSVRIDTALGG